MRARRDFLARGAAALVGLGLPGPARALASQHAGYAERPAVHGMVVLGRDAVFLSHLPLFESPGHDSPHDYQVLLEASLRKDGSDPRALYAADAAKTGTRLYTLEPERFVLPELGATGSPLRSFKGTVYRGHFERGGAPVARDVTVDVTRVIYFRKFDPADERPKRLEYVLFGKGRELFLAHAITRPPDFDQLLAVKLTGIEVHEDDLAAGVRVTFPGRRDSIAARARPGQRLVCELRRFGSAARWGSRARIAVVGEHYFESGELAS